MAKQILSGSVGHHATRRSRRRGRALEGHRSRKEKRLSRRKRETWCPGEMALPSSFDLKASVTMANIAEVEEDQE